MFSQVQQGFCFDDMPGRAIVVVAFGVDVSSYARSMTAVPHALEPVYAFGGPGDPVVLHEGPATVDETATDGRIELRLLPRLSVAWTANRVAGPAVGDPIALGFCTPSGSAETTAHCGSLGPDLGGWIDRVEVGSRTGALHRVIAHWLNLPSLNGSERICDERTGWTCTDRWSFVVAGWRITIDQRPGHRDTWRQAKDSASSVLTHVMQVRREDGSTFTADDVDPVLEALRLGFSFALGRWVAPVLPVGFARTGERIWEEWSPLLCTGGQPGSLRWWFPQRAWEMENLLEGLLAVTGDPAKRFGIRFVVSSSVLAATGGFIEQRIMTAFAALENLSWQRLVVDGPLTATQYKSKEWHTAKRLTALLDSAAIPIGLDGLPLPGLRAAGEWLPIEVERTGPGIVTYVRNKIVHPTDPESQLYGRDGDLVTEAWRLTHHYLTLLILNLVEYHGSYQRNLSPGGYEGDVVAVPWAAEGQAT